MQIRSIRVGTRRFVKGASDLGRLTHEERTVVFDAMGPDKKMQLYDRGIRRRLAPMLDGDRRSLELSYSLLFTLPALP